MSKIEVESFFKIDDKFVSVRNFSGRLDDMFYVNGAILLSIDGKEIIGFKQWDLIDQLWSYIIQGLFLIEKGKKFETYFPDTPIKFMLTPSGKNHVVVERDSGERNVRVHADKSDLLRELAFGARDFFDVFSKLDDTWMKSEEKIVLDDIIKNLP